MKAIGLTDFGGPEVLKIVLPAKKGRRSGSPLGASAAGWSSTSPSRFRSLLRPAARPTPVDEPVGCGSVVALDALATLVWEGSSSVSGATPQIQRGWVSSHSTATKGKEPAMPARGSAEWKGDVPSGTGTFTAGDTISGGYTYKSRFEDGPGSNPEQLIAAAHAACFSMSLSNILAQAGSPPDSVHTDATVTLRPVEGVPTITKIDLVTVGKVPGIDEAAFVEHAKAAKAGCPVSRALAGVPEITLEASLAP